MQPKLNWMRRGDYEMFDAMADDYGRLQLCIGHMVERGKWHMEVTWQPPMAMRSHKHSHLLTVVNEPAHDLHDAVDVMVRCEQRARAAILAQFGGLL